MNSGLDETFFPKSIVAEVIEILKAKKCHFETFNQCNLSLSLPQLDSLAYRTEFLKFRYGTKSTLNAICCGLRAKLHRIGVPTPAPRYGRKNPTAFLQHDADQRPERTLDLMKLEREQGVVSSSFFFREQNEESSSGFPYDLPVEELQKLEEDGFEIGYHLNSVERAGYSLEKATELALEDIQELSKLFSIHSFVPHGGISGPDGLNNEMIPYQGELRNFAWCYNGQGFTFDHYWSDGEIYVNKVEDPRLVAERVKGGERVLFLMHPQYYGDQLSSRVENTKLPSLGWWKALW